MTQCSGRGLESKSKGKGHNKLSGHSVLLVGECIWGYQSSDQAVAKLWRSRDDVDSVVGYPGSSLCATTPMDQCGKSVVSQNHKTGIRMREREGSFWFARMKASCLLPEVGYVSRWFLVPGPKQPTGYI